MRRRWKVLLAVAAMAYLAISWLAFLLPPRMETSPEVPAEATKAISHYCEGSDYLWRYPWGLPASVFWGEPFTHREFRLRKIVIQRVTDSRVRALCLSTGKAVWFELEGGERRLDSKMLLTY